MVKRFLITTALEETWHNDEPVLFLGEWCCSFSRKDRWSRMDAEMLSYHWDDRAKLFADYQYLQNFYERLLKDLTAQLNEIHSVDHSLRYWRILLGPWLGSFVQILFDRWTSIQQAVSQFDLSETVVLTGYEECLVPNDMVGFINLYSGEDWNHHIYASILQSFTAVPCIRKPLQDIEVTQHSPPEKTLKGQVKRVLLNCYSRFASTLCRNQDAFLLSTRLLRRDEIRLQKHLGQVPQIWCSPPPYQVAVDRSQRKWVCRGESLSLFEYCSRALIPQHIPSTYLEGYGELVKQIGGLSWPKQPKVIWTSNAYNADDVFKAWAAEKVEEGSPLVIGQHGGHYGVGQWSFFEDHEIAISDTFLSWGWSETSQPKVKPVGQFQKRQPLHVCHADKSGALLVTCALPKFSYWMYSVFVSRQYLDYFSDQCAFVSALPSSIRNKLTVRLFPHDFGWEQFSRWRHSFSDLRIDKGHSNINELIRNSRIYISSYNATTFLESFTLDVPTVIFWNPAHWELRESAIPFFDELKCVGIFHDTPESAALHVAAIWSSVDSWWYCPSVREVLNRFKARYCHVPDNLIDKLQGVLCEVMANEKSC